MPTGMRIHRQVAQHRHDLAQRDRADDLHSVSVSGHYDRAAL